MKNRGLCILFMIYLRYLIKLNIKKFSIFQALFLVSSVWMAWSVSTVGEVDSVGIVLFMIVFLQVVTVGQYVMLWVCYSQELFWDKGTLLDILLVNDSIAKSYKRKKRFLSFVGLERLAVSFLTALILRESRAETLILLGADIAAVFVETLLFSECWERKYLSAAKTDEVWLPVLVVLLMTVYYHPSWWCGLGIVLTLLYKLVYNEWRIHGKNQNKSK